MPADTATPNAAAAGARPAIPDVLAEHLEEHAFLCVQRRKLVFSPELPLRRLPQHDERIDAHWDGLVVGGADSAELALEKLGGDDPWQVATAACVWMEIGRATPAAIAEKLAAAPPEQSPSWREAFRRCPAALVTAALDARALGTLPAPALAVAVDALAWHEALPATLAQQAARHADDGVRAALARALAHAALPEPLPLLRGLLDDPQPAVAARALWSLALLSPAAALERARKAARASTSVPFAVRVLGLLGEPQDHAAITAAAATDAGRLAAFWAFADLGTDEAIDSLIRLLALPDKELATLVGEVLETAIGTVAREKPDKPPTPEQAHAHWAHVAGTLPREARVMAGSALPWHGEPAEEPMRWLWRAAIAGSPAAPAWLARAVPDGFFEAVPAPDARPGE